jgi:hypothetical protein
MDAPEGMLAVGALDAVEAAPAQIAVVAAVVMAMRNGQIAAKDAVRIAEHLLQEVYAVVLQSKPN